MTDKSDAIKLFAAALAAETDPAAREHMLARVKMLAMNAAPEEAFEPPIRTLNDYLAAEIEMPPVLINPFMCVRGGMNVTVGRAGKGKFQPHHSKVLTRSGWTTMGEVQVGDYVVNPDGGEAKVVGKFPQGVQPA